MVTGVGDPVETAPAIMMSSFSVRGKNSTSWFVNIVYIYIYIYAKQSNFSILGHYYIYALAEV